MTLGFLRERPNSPEVIALQRRVRELEERIAVLERERRGMLKQSRCSHAKIAKLEVQMGRDLNAAVKQRETITRLHSLIIISELGSSAEAWAFVRSVLRSRGVEWCA